MQLTRTAISLTKMNIKCIAALMVHFNRGQWTIQDWLEPSHKMHYQLTHPSVIRIISEHTALSNDDILQEAPELAATG